MSCLGRASTNNPNILPKWQLEIGIPEPRKLRPDLSDDAVLGLVKRYVGFSEMASNPVDASSRKGGTIVKHYGNRKCEATAGIARPSSKSDKRFSIPFYFLS